MKNNVLMKGVLLLIVLAVLSMGFTGCVLTYPTYPTTGTVYLVVSGGWTYDLYMDYNKKYSAVPQGTYVLYNVPVGNRFFEAIDTWGWTYGYSYTTQYIYGGVINYIYLYP